MKEFVCIVCPNGCRLTVSTENGKTIVSGQKCPKGEAFAVEEATAPKRSVTSTVRTVYKEYPVAPVKTDGEIPKEKIKDLIQLLKSVTISSPLRRGETVLADVFGTGVNVVVTADIYRALEELNHG